MSDGLREGEYVFVEVTDDGCGMDEATCSKIFEPFITSKPTGHGLGMSVVLGIIRSHNGAIRVDSKPDRGTTVTIYFPAFGESDPA